MAIVFYACKFVDDKELGCSGENSHPCKQCKMPLCNKHAGEHNCKRDDWPAAYQRSRTGGN